MTDDPAEQPVFRTLCLTVRDGYAQFPDRCCLPLGHDGEHRGGRSVHFEATSWNDEKEET